MLRVAKDATQVAATETHEDGWRSAMVAFTLKGIEYFVYFVHVFFLTKPTKLAKPYLGHGKAANRPAFRRQPSWVPPSIKDSFDGFVGFVTIKSIKVLRGIVLDVGGLVVARLPHIGAVAVRDSVDNPLGQVLGRRVEVQHLIDVGMVDLAVYQALDLGEIAHHAVAVKLLGSAIHIDLPVVAMQVLAFALIVEIKLVAG
jgi:hypothetical protein